MVATLLAWFLETPKYYLCLSLCFNFKKKPSWSLRSRTKHGDPNTCRVLKWPFLGTILPDNTSVVVSLISYLSKWFLNKIQLSPWLKGPFGSFFLILCSYLTKCDWQILRHQCFSKCFGLEGDIVSVVRFHLSSHSCYHLFKNLFGYHSMK